MEPERGNKTARELPGALRMDADSNGGPSVPVNNGKLASLPLVLSVIVTLAFVAEESWLIRSTLFENR